MPSYSGSSNNTGADSWGNLIAVVYSIPTGYNNPRGYNRARNWPLHFLPTGDYSGGYGDYSSENNGFATWGGHWWSMTYNYDQNYGIYSYNLGIDYWTSPNYSGAVRPNSSTRRGQGNAIRCVVRS